MYFTHFNSICKYILFTFYFTYSNSICKYTVLFLNVFHTLQLNLQICFIYFLFHILQFYLQIYFFFDKSTFHTPPQSAFFFYFTYSKCYLQMYLKLYFTHSTQSANILFFYISNTPKSICNILYFVLKIFPTLQLHLQI